MNTPGTFLDFLHEWSGWFCHQLAERSPQAELAIFPVCFRCAGWQLGLFASYVALFAGGNRRGRFPSLRVALMCVAFMLPFVIDGFGNAFHVWSSPGWFRGLTGLGVGLGIPWLLAPLVQGDDPIGPASLENLRPLLWPALFGGVAVMALTVGAGLIAFRALAVAAAAGWFVFVGHFVFGLICSYVSPANSPPKQLPAPSA